jgi:hypothetical protein
MYHHISHPKLKWIIAHTIKHIDRIATHVEIHSFRFDLARNELRNCILFECVRIQYHIVREMKVVIFLAQDCTR